MTYGYIHYIQVFRDGKWVDFESYSGLERAKRRADEIRRSGHAVQIVSLKQEIRS